MKLLTRTLLIILAFTTVILFDSCKKESNTNPDDTIELPDLKAEMMTLSAIAYLADSSGPDVIKETIINSLKDTILATKGEWKLVWGPGISQLNENLVYVTRNDKSNSYAIAIRGTSIYSIGDIIEDLDAFNMARVTFGKPEDSVSHGAWTGFKKLLSTQDPESGHDLEHYLSSIQESDIPLIVTGHSQGGGLAPIMAYWLMTHDMFSTKFNIHTYAYAGPGWFNKNFKENFNDRLNPSSSFNMMVNSLDAIPYGYADLLGIIENKIPTDVPFDIGAAIIAFDAGLKAKKVKYYNISVADTIGFIPITNFLNSKDIDNDYTHWLAVEHNHNNYLKLLGAEPVDK